MGDIDLVAMVAAAADAVVIVSWCSPWGGHRLGNDGRTAAADAAAIVVLVLSSWGDIGVVAMVGAAADAVVIVVLVLSSWGDIGLVAMVVLLLLMQQ